MKQTWTIEPVDIQRVATLLEEEAQNAWVKQRIAYNLAADKAVVGRAGFWKQMVACLLTSRQRSDADAPITRFNRVQPYPLAYETCLAQKDLFAFAQKVLTDFGGIRFTTNIPQYLASNLEYLEGGFWAQMLDALEHLRTHQDAATERLTADLIDESFSGFGPKQARNLLQALCLSRYEIPLDSRLTKWFNDFGFPVRLSDKLLTDRDYYCFVLDGIQELCRAANVIPCVLDAAIFARNGGWTDENVESIY
jgi:N-glycosylase/DNA lyase